MPISSTSPSRAPGKLVFLGEYAVLDGAPALVAAVDRFAYASARTHDHWCLAAPNLNVSSQTWVPGAGRDATGAFALSLSLLDVLVEDGVIDPDRPCHIELNSAELYGAGGKLGLGSSAAILTALYRLFDEGSDIAAAFERIDRAHRFAQKGLGSGVDVAAALAGGLSVFQREPDWSVRRAALPNGLHWRAVATGQSASTAAFLARVARFKADQPAEFAAHITALRTLAEAGVVAVKSNDAAEFCGVAGHYGDALAQFGHVSGVDILSAPHQQLRDVAAQVGVAYKVSGAGGGDLGLAFTTDADRLLAFEKQIAALDGPLGMVPLALAAPIAK